MGSDGTSVRKRGKSIFPNSLANLLRKAFKQVHQSMEWRKKEAEKQVEFKMLRGVRKVCSREKTWTSGEWTSAWSGNA